MEFLRNAEPEELLALLLQWTGNLKTTFTSIPEIAALLPRVQEDHDALLSLDAGASAAAALEILNATATPLDLRHDHLQRALRLGLQSAVELLSSEPTPDEALIEKIEAVLGRLQPDGLLIIGATYEAEAGNAAIMVKTAAEPDVAAVLAQIPIMTGITAADLVSRIGKIGASLGSIEQQKSVAVQVAKKAAVTPAETKRRLNNAARTVETIISALDRSAAPADTILAIRQPILDAVEKARSRKLAQRAAKKKAAEEKAAEAKAKAPGTNGAAQPAPLSVGATEGA